MSVSQQKLLSVLKDQVAAIDESVRVPHYKDELLQTLGQIVALERGHLEAATQIQKKVTDQSQALGRFLHDQGWTPSAGDSSDSAR